MLDLIQEKIEFFIKIFDEYYYIVLDVLVIASDTTSLRVFCKKTWQSQEAFHRNFTRSPESLRSFVMTWLHLAMTPMRNDGFAHYILVHSCVHVIILMFTLNNFIFLHESFSNKTASL